MPVTSKLTRLPEGVVTFLLTDVVGSTRLWESAPDVMAAVIARHYELLHGVVSAHGGALPVEQGEGDSVVAVFRSATDAAAAATAAQLALGVESWPADVNLAVRMALHTGQAVLRDAGNYAGEAIIRTARLRALAHGGQVVASRACVELAQAGAQVSVGWRELGFYRLKDLGRPEQVFQLIHPELPGEFPPLRGVDAVTNNLPIQLTPFIGREAELAQLHALLDDTRLLTLTGSGGCGKTRLALHAVADRIDRHPDGVWYVELAPLGESSSVVSALAEVLRVQDSAELPLLDAIVANLRDRRALVVIDNCEHLLTESAMLIDALLRGCPALQVVATSRQPLNLPGEVTWRVPSLRTPEPGAPVGPAALDQFDAVQLFVERAVRARPNFRVTNDNAAYVAQICQELDGIPLAIELAAARVRNLSVARIADGLNDRFRLLRGGATTLQLRQQTLQGSVEWSHQLLDDRERVLLRRLACFCRGFTLDAAEDVSGFAPLQRIEVLDLLSELVDRSLVVHDDTNDRYRLLETIKQFARQRLDAVGETVAVLDRHVAHFAELAQQLAPVLETGDQQHARATLAAEHENLRVALEHAATLDDPLPLSRMAFALTFYWLQTVRTAEGRGWLARAIERLDHAHPVLDARLRWALGYLAYYYGDFEQLGALASDALDAATAAGDTLAIARAQDLVGDMLQIIDPAAAAQLLEAAIPTADASANIWTRVDVRQKLAYAHMFEDRYRDMQRWLDDACSLGLADANPFFVAWHHNGALTAMIRNGDPDVQRIEPLARRAAYDSGDLATIAWTTSRTAQAWLRYGRRDEAEQLLASLTELVAARAGGQSAQGPLQLATWALRDWAGDWTTLADETAATYEAWKHAGITFMETAVGEPRARAALALADPAAAPFIAAYADGAKRLGSPLHIGLADLFTGVLAIRDGDPERGAALARAALQTWIDQPYDVHVAEALDALAWACAAGGDDTGAGRYLTVTGRHRAALGWASSASEKAWRAAAHAAVTNQDAFATGATSAAGLSLTDAVRLALRARGPRLRPHAGWASLTPTEHDVAKLVAQGRSNPQVAEQLFMSRATVKTHLNHVYTKLAITSRAELAAAWARDRH